MSYIEYLFIPLYSTAAFHTLTMLPSASDNVAHSWYTLHYHTSLRFTDKRDIILTQDRARYINKNVEYNF